MTRDEIVATLKAHRPRLHARGVAHVALFGSRGRGDARAGSDLDVLIDVDPGTPKFSLLDLAGVCGLLTEITGIETVAIERHMLARDPGFARRIAPDIVEVF